MHTNTINFLNFHHKPVAPAFQRVGHYIKDMIVSFDKARTAAWLAQQNPSDHEISRIIFHD